MPSYEVKVTVPSLESASELMSRLAEGGYTEVSMAPSGAADSADLEHIRAATNRLNDLILGALYRTKALGRDSAVTVDGIVQGLKEMPGTETMFSARGEGVISRTASMVASSILGDKHSWVEYQKTNPRRFWLTAKGAAQAELLLGEGAR